MRSDRKKRNEELEDAFDKELTHFSQSIWGWRSANKFRNREISSTLNIYINELNKVRKYACPISTAILLSAIMEGVLLLRVLDEHELASKTSAWRKNTTPDDGDFPNFSLAQLILIVDELKWLRSVGRQALVSKFYLRTLIKQSRFMAGMVEKNKVISQVSFPEWDAKQNSVTMRNLRQFRNGIHPKELAKDKNRKAATDFIEVLWDGLRLLVFLEFLIGVEPFLAQQSENGMKA